MNLRQIMDAFYEVEHELEISEPHHQKIRHVYKYLPPATDALDLPCTMHQYRRISASRVIGSRESSFVVRVQLLVAKLDSQSHIRSEMLAAWDEVLVNAFDHAVMLGGTSAFQRIEDEQTELQPVIIPWQSTDYLGVQYDYRVYAHANVVFS